MKLGSLFDGSGGFPLAGALCGIEPIWASEVEPYPITVTKSRFPNMKHLGDISKVNGAEIEPVDIITFGSPCQDLSVAGKRAGLKHEDNGDDETTRSGLFIEAVRIIKEMREKTNGKYPRYAVWENVPGAFSSNKGEDFRVVLEELVKVVEPSAVMPEVPQFGWAYADSYCGDGWSLAYRVLDAQYWGVPQRRRRIYLVADFGGQRAREILFEREGLRGYFTEGRTPWKATPSDAERSVGADDREGEIPYTLKIRSGVSVDSYGKAAGKGALIQKNLSATLGVSQDQYLFQPMGFDRYNQCSTGEKCETLRTPGGGDNYPTVCYGIDGYNATETGDKSATLGVNCGMSTGRNGVCVQEPIAVATQQGGAEITENGVCPTITAAAGMSGNNQPWICKEIDKNILDDQGGSQITVRSDGKAPTLRAEMHGNVPCVMESAKEVYGVDAYNQTLTGDKAKTLNSAASDADHVPCAVYSIENHPADSRVKIDSEGKVQALTGRMGTGGGNVPMVMEEIPKVVNLNKGDVQSKTILDPNGIAPSLYAGECRGGGGECYVMDTVALEGNGQRPSHHGDGYLETDKSYTLNATEVHGVAYSFDPGASRDVGVLFIEECGKTLTNGTCPGHHDGVVISRPVHTITTGSFTQIEKEKSPTLMARDYKDPTCVEIFDAKQHRYIVRRLTPTECARLQGFADRWGDIEPKSDFTDEEYRFWLEVRNTHAAINGKAVKEYNKKQMLTWYNKLHTDSAEYKMWGNGIALPTALYVIQGITEGERK